MRSLRSALADNVTFLANFLKVHLRRSEYGWKQVPGRWRRYRRYQTYLARSRMADASDEETKLGISIGNGRHVGDVVEVYCDFK